MTYVPGEHMYNLNNIVKLYTCVFCHKTMFYKPLVGQEPTTEGQVYSEAGVREVGISGVCEHCFDAVTKDVQDDEANDLAEIALDELIELDKGDTPKGNDS